MPCELHILFDAVDATHLAARRTSQTLFTFSQTQDRDNLKLDWIKHSLNELRNGRWVIPALKQIKAICELFYEVIFSLPINTVSTNNYSNLFTGNRSMD